LLIILPRHDERYALLAIRVILYAGRSLAVVDTYADGSLLAYCWTSGCDMALVVTAVIIDGAIEKALLLKSYARC